jgi:myosin-crossreactive antigen
MELTVMVGCRMFCITDKEFKQIEDEFGDVLKTGINDMTTEQIQRGVIYHVMSQRDKVPEFIAEMRKQ